MAILLALRRFISIDGPAFTSVFQGAARFNTFIGLAIAGALYGQPGLVMAALAVAIMIPLVNTPSVIVLTRYGGIRGVGFSGAALAIARNPIILATIVGAGLGMAEIGLPPILGPALAILGAAALPLGLIGVGAGLDFASLRASGRAVALAATVKLAALPLATYWICEVIGVDGLTQTIAVLFNALPASVSSYALARQMGGDYRLMAGILTVEMLAAGVTLPIVLIALR
jgi:predicted permease